MLEIFLIQFVIMFEFVDCYDVNLADCLTDE